MNTVYKGWQQIKSAAYSSQESHTFNYTAATHWQMEVRRDNVISIALRRLLVCNFLSEPLLLSQLATQLSSRDWLDPVIVLIHI